MKAVVLAAGKGTRFGDLAKNIPKVLIKIGKKPFLDFVLRDLKKAGFKDIGIVVGYKKEMMKEYLKDKKVTIIEQGEPLGTGHAISKVKDFVGNEPFLVIMGDNLYSPEDLKELSKEKNIVIAAKEVDDPSRYGVLVTKGKKLKKIVEKPKDPPTNLVNTGLYVFTKEIFDEIKKLKKSERGEYEITDALTNLAKKNLVNVYVIKDYWVDFGKPEDIPIVHSFLKKK